MFIAEVPTPIDGLASAASVILIIEVGLIVILLAALAVLIALLMRWMYNHTIPPIQQAVPKVKGAVDATDRMTGRVIDIVATLYSRRRGFEVAIQTFIEGAFPAEPVADDMTDAYSPRDDMPDE